MSVIGVAVSGVSVGLFKHAALGVDPFQSLMSGLDAVIPLRFGTLYVLANAVLLLFSLLLDRRKIGLATLINLFLLGYIAEYSQAFFARLLPGPGPVLRFLLLLAALVILCLASAFYFTADLGVVGIGTILTAFNMGPLISWFRQHAAEPFLRGKT